MIRSRGGYSHENETTLSSNLNKDEMKKSTSADKGYSRLTKLFIAFIILTAGGFLIYHFLSYPNELPASHSHSKRREITVVVNTFKRFDIMEGAIEYYSQCNLVKYIYVVCSPDAPTPNQIVARFTSQHIPKVDFIHPEKDSLNNRFRPLTLLNHTNAIFSVDDDVRVPCEDLATAYEIWRGSSRSLVGFMPRLHLRRTDGNLDYRCWWRVWWHGFYSIILTKAALLHHDYLALYTHHMPTSIHKLVDNEWNCEDIAMQFLIANATNLPPIYVKGHLQDLGVLSGISTSQNVVSAKHMDRRSFCLNALVKEYGGKNPLVRSNVIVDSAANRYTNAPSTWWEFVSSDLWKF